MKKVRIIILLIIISSITSFFYINYIGSKFNDVIYKYINDEVKRFSYNVVNTAVNDVLAKTDTNNLFIIMKRILSLTLVELSTTNHYYFKGL